MKSLSTSVVKQNKSSVVILLVTAVVLLIPLIAMQFTKQVAWTLKDFITVGVLLLGFGLAYELLTRKIRTSKSRAIVGFILLAVFILVWIDLAVGIFGTPFSGS